MTATGRTPNPRTVADPATHRGSGANGGSVSAARARRAAASRASEAPAVLGCGDRSSDLAGPHGRDRFRLAGTRTRGTAHEGVGNDGEKYRIDTVTLDAVDTRGQVAILLQLHTKGFGLQRPGRRDHTGRHAPHLDSDLHEVNMAPGRQIICDRWKASRRALPVRPKPYQRQRLGSSGRALRGGRCERVAPGSPTSEVLPACYIPARRGQVPVRGKRLFRRPRGNRRDPRLRLRSTGAPRTLGAAAPVRRRNG